MHWNKKILFLTALFLLPAATALLSGQDAIDFVSKTNSLLLGNEIVEILPNVKITHESKAYWLVGIISGDSLTGFVPVSVESPEIPKGNTVRKELVETAYYLRSHSRIKGLALQQDLWIFSSLNSKRMNELATQLQSESSLDLTTVGSELQDFPELLNTLEKIRSDIEIIQPKAQALSSDILDAVAFENAFYNNPDTATLDTLKEKFSAIFSQIKALESDKTTYILDIDELVQGIAQTNLPIETKKSLGALANPPSREINYLSSLANSSTTLEEQLLQAFDDALSRSQTLVENLETRIRRNTAYLILYGQDTEIIDNTNQSTLYSLVNMILSDDYSSYWKNQEEKVFLSDNWQKAEAYFENGSFETAITFAEKSKDNALAVYSEGLEEPEPMLDTDFLITMAVLIIILLIILYIIKNREKLTSLVSDNEEVERFEFDE